MADVLPAGAQWPPDAGQPKRWRPSLPLVRHVEEFPDRRVFVYEVVLHADGVAQVEEIVRRVMLELPRR